MQVTISTKKLFQVLYWTLYLGLCFISGWFASGVVDNYFSRKTSFSQDKEIATKRPVISIKLNPISGESRKSNKNRWEFMTNNNTWIDYCPSYELWKSQCAKLVLGENEFLIEEINETEKVFFEQIGYYSTYRIIPLTNLLGQKASAFINISAKAKYNLSVSIYLTSLENSVGSPYHIFKDGDYFEYVLEKNTIQKFIIKPERYNFLPQTSKCRQESYYDCLALELEKFDFNQTSCTTKCIPKMFSYGKNYDIPFCQNYMDDKCARRIFHAYMYHKTENSFTKKVDLKCKHSCTILQYSGSVVHWNSIFPKNESYNEHQFEYQFGNTDNKMTVFHEYLIYDSMGMIGSVGGTFGMFIGFSMTGVISSIIEFFKERKIGRKFLV